MFSNPKSGAHFWLQKNLTSVTWSILTPKSYIRNVENPNIQMIRPKDPQQLYISLIIIPPNSNKFSCWRRSSHMPWLKTHKLPSTNKIHRSRRKQLGLSTQTSSGHGPQWTSVNQNFSHSFFCFCVGRYNKKPLVWPHGKQRVMFSLHPQCFN